MKDKLVLKNGLIGIMVLLVALSRLIPHPPNFTPVGAMALFGAAYFSRKYLAFLIPLLAMWLSDLLLNNLVYANLYPEFYQGFTWFGSLWVYLSFAAIALLGFALLKKVKPGKVLYSSLIASVLFFLVTNFGAWISSPAMPSGFPGLMMTYAAGIPFFWNTLLGDLFFVGVLFGAYALLRARFPQLKVAG